MILDIVYSCRHRPANEPKSKNLKNQNNSAVTKIKINEIRRTLQIINDWKIIISRQSSNDVESS